MVSTPTFVEPKVYLVTRPQVDWGEMARFLEDESLPPAPVSVVAGMDESASVVEISARLCYMSFGRGRKDIAEFIDNLLRMGDGSVLEHVNYGFAITGVSRSLSLEFVRHRAGFAYSQRSQRYVDENGGTFVAPPLLQGLAPPARRIVEEAAEDAAATYRDLVRYLDEAVPPAADRRDTLGAKTARRKAIRSAARSVLPNATETKMFVTANVRAWRHFIEQRASEYADAEIRRLALMILEVLQREAPLLFGDFKVTGEGQDRTAAPLYSKV